MDAQNSPEYFPTHPSPRMAQLPRPGWRDIVVLLLGYLALDWASHLHPLHGLNITPWNPAPALGLVFLLRFGGGAVLPVAGAIVLAETVVRDLAVALPMSFFTSCLIAGAYWLTAQALRRVLPGRPLPGDGRGLLLWFAVIGLGTLLNSALFVLALSMAGYLPSSGIAGSVFQYWVGDATGIVVTLPLLQMLFDELDRRRLSDLVFDRRALPIAAAVFVALWIAFEVGARADFKYFYVLFLPIAWAAASFGLAGAVAAAALIQLGIIGAVLWQGLARVTVIEIQVLAAAVALFGFFIGVVVDAMRRVSGELRQTLRLAAAGDMAGAMAHELNQPLTALATYGSACEHLLATDDSGDKLRDAVRGMVRESARAAEVMRRLRDFFRTGTTRLETETLKALVERAVAGFGAKAAQAGIRLEIDEMADCTLLCDRLQIEVVLRNLLSNAVDAVQGQAEGRRWIRLSAQPEGPSNVRLSVEDGGRGLDDARLARLFAGFQSTKSSGLGLGLVISRAIAEAHGGHLWAEAGDRGMFRLLLPVESWSAHDR